MPDPNTPMQEDAAGQDTVPCSTGPLAQLLAQLRELVAPLDTDTYNTKPDTTCCGAIGGHVRHCLDHVQALTNGLDTGEIDYADRVRGTAIECMRTAALEAIASLRAVIAGLPEGAANRRIGLAFAGAAGAPARRIETTVGRELAFVISHTIHHHAMIGVMGKSLGLAPPPRFGMAPSTIAHLDRD